jgi:hypothetical protein
MDHFLRFIPVENPEEGYLKFLPKSRGGGGGAGLKEKLPGGPPISGFICIAFLLTSVLKFAWGGESPPIYPPTSSF